MGAQLVRERFKPRLSYPTICPENFPWAAEVCLELTSPLPPGTALVRAVHDPQPRPPNSHCHAIANLPGTGTFLKELPGPSVISVQTDYLLA